MAFATSIFISSGIGSLLPPQLRFHSATFISCVQRSGGPRTSADAAAVPGGAPRCASEARACASACRVMRCRLVRAARSISRFMPAASSSLSLRPKTPGTALLLRPEELAAGLGAGSGLCGAASRSWTASASRSSRGCSFSSPTVTHSPRSGRASAGSAAGSPRLRRRPSSSLSLSSPRRFRRFCRRSSSSHFCVRIRATASDSSRFFFSRSSSSWRCRWAWTRSCLLPVRRDVTVPGTGWSPVPADLA
mmetsp:Transcript_20799/g.60272  ORF Transcript_20799/g.60272 Transcript_20799/m.60272 type:complete len:249 (-) Transcript_20799:41-787(-)